MRDAAFDLVLLSLFRPQSAPQVGFRPQETVLRKGRAELTEMWAAAHRRTLAPE
jgi:hypothetical protein